MSLFATDATKGDRLTEDKECREKVKDVNDGSRARSAAGCWLAHRFVGVIGGGQGDRQCALPARSEATAFGPLVRGLAIWYWCSPFK